MNFRFEPARVIALVRAGLTLATAMGILVFTEAQELAIVAFLTSALDLIMGEAIRSQVVPVAKLPLPADFESDEDKHPTGH